jgi:hypothetical protein
LRNNGGAFAAEQYYMSANPIAGMFKVKRQVCRHRFTDRSRSQSALIGPACGAALNSVGRMASHWDIPVFTAGGIEDNFSNKNIFRSLTRLSFSLGN